MKEREDSYIVQTKIGAAKAKAREIERLGSEEAYRAFRRKIAAIGGSRSTPTGGFGNKNSNPSASGRLGGSHSKIGYKFIKEDKNYMYFTQNTTGETVKFKKNG